MPICSRSAGEVVVRLRLVDDSDVASARRHVRELGRLHAMSEPDLEALATAVSETVRNVIVHAERGELEVAVREGDERWSSFVATNPASRTPRTPCATVIRRAPGSAWAYRARAAW